MGDIDYAQALRLIRKHMQPGDTLGRMFMRVAKALEESDWKCMGRRQALPEPADCNWPDCGCDPHATKVIESLLEQGWTGPKQT